MSTIKDIAKFCNVSIGTVDRVIHNRGRVASETESKIKNAIKQLDYHPNAFARNLKLSKTFTFHILLPEVSQDDGYWSLVLKGARRAYDEFKTHGVEIEYFHYNRYSLDSFFNQGKQSIQSQPDAIIIVPTETIQTRQFIKQFPDKIPYVMIDSPTPKTNPLCFIGQDGLQSGYLAAKIMSMLIAKDQDIAMIQPYQNVFHINRRIQGFKNFMDENSMLKYKLYLIDWEKHPDPFRELMEKIMKEMKKLGGIFVSNAYTHHFSKLAEQLGIANDIRIIGYDLIPKNIEGLKSGAIDFIISQKPEEQGYQSVYVLFRHLVLNELIPETIMMPLDIITRENMMYYH